MTNKQAIKILKSWDGSLFVRERAGAWAYGYEEKVTIDAVSLAVKALQENEKLKKEIQELKGKKSNSSRNFELFTNSNTHSHIDPDYGHD